MTTTIDAKMQETLANGNCTAIQSQLPKFKKMMCGDTTLVIDAKVDLGLSNVVKKAIMAEGDKPRGSVTVMSFGKPMTDGIMFQSPLKIGGIWRWVTVHDKNFNGILDTGDEVKFASGLKREECEEAGTRKTKVYLCNGSSEDKQSWISYYTIGVNLLASNSEEVCYTNGKEDGIDVDTHMKIVEEAYQSALKMVGLIETTSKPNTTSKQIQFESTAQSATKQETKNYKKLKNQELFGHIAKRLVCVDDYDVNMDGKDEVLGCKGEQPASGKDGEVKCSIFEEGASDKSMWWTDPFVYKGQNELLTEVRFGDIDSDGDIDMAFKMSNGAIYIYHNLIK